MRRHGGRVCGRRARIGRGAAGLEEQESEARPAQRAGQVIRSCRSRPAAARPPSAQARPGGREFPPTFTLSGGNSFLILRSGGNSRGSGRPMTSHIVYSHTACGLLGAWGVGGGGRRDGGGIVSPLDVCRARGGGAPRARQIHSIEAILGPPGVFGRGCRVAGNKWSTTLTGRRLLGGLTWAGGAAAQLAAARGGTPPPLRTSYCPSSCTMGQPAAAMLGASCSQASWDNTTWPPCEESPMSWANCRGRGAKRGGGGHELGNTQAN